MPSQKAAWNTARTAFDQETDQTYCLPRASPQGTATSESQRRLFRVSRNGGTPTPGPHGRQVSRQTEQTKGASSHEGRQGRKASHTDGYARECPIPERQESLSLKEVPSNARRRHEAGARRAIGKGRETARLKPRRNARPMRCRAARREPPAHSRRVPPEARPSPDRADSDTGSP